MDTKARPAAVSAAEVEASVALIKGHMPNVYKSIQAKAAEIGTEAFALVRRGLRGEPNCFYAFEGGRVVGTPFAGHPIMEDVARTMAEFGCAHVCIWSMKAALVEVAPVVEPPDPPRGVMRRADLAASAQA